MIHGFLLVFSWIVKAATWLSCYMDLSKLLCVIPSLCQTKPSWSLIKILKLVDWLKALNKVWRLNASGPMCPWQCFYEICKRNIYGTKEKLLDGPLPPPYKDDNIDPTSWQKKPKICEEPGCRLGVCRPKVAVPPQIHVILTNLSPIDHRSISFRLKLSYFTILLLLQWMEKECRHPLAAADRPEEL